MAYKKTDKCCRYCKWRGWGKTSKTQRNDSIVCLRRPKVYKDQVFNIEPHFYATRLGDCCEHYERREVL